MTITMEIYTRYSNIDKNLIYSDWNEVFDCIANLLNRIDSGLTHKLKDSYYQWEYSIDIYLKTLKREAVQPFPKLRTLGTIRPFNLSNFSIIGKQENNQEVLLKMRDVLNDNIVTLTLIKSMVEAENKSQYLILKDNMFLYDQSKLPFSTDTHVYIILKTLYICPNGVSGEVRYDTLFKELRKNKRYQKTIDKKLKDYLSKYLSSKLSDLGKKLRPVENNGRKLIDVKRGWGIIFNNSD